MFVITADQVDSRSEPDRAGALIELLESRFGTSFPLSPDQTAGDEVQLMTEDARVALDAILAIHRSGQWSIGLGLGSVRLPLPAATRQAAGGAFIAARAAVTRAKRADTRFALDAAASDPGADAGRAGATDAGAIVTAPELESLIGIVLLLRQRRSVEGWEAVDLIESGLSQAQAAARLGVSTAAISQRIKTASWRAEMAARPALVRLLAHLQRATIETEPAE